MHIDVYCTGSDEDGDGDASSSEDSDLSPQTVFESEGVRVVHSRAPRDALPQALQPAASRRQVAQSCRYPLRDLAADPAADLASSRDSSFSSLYPSRTNTERSLASMASLATIYSTTSGTSGLSVTGSITQSDSFEYADSIDRARILEKEKCWAAAGAGDWPVDKSWRSPQLERRRHLQEQRFQRFLDEHPRQLDADTTTTTDSDSTADTGSEMAWSFGRNSSANSSRPASALGSAPSGPSGAASTGGVGGLRREDTVRRAPAPTAPIAVPARQEAAPTASSAPLPLLTTTPATPLPRSDRDALLARFAPPRPVGPFGGKAAAGPGRLPASAFAPFCGTQQTASRFGTVLGLRRPGHHVGPAKNPECSCDNCTAYFRMRDRDRSQGRARSMDGDSWGFLSITQSPRPGGGPGRGLSVPPDHPLAAPRPPAPHHLHHHLDFDLDPDLGTPV